MKSFDELVVFSTDKGKIEHTEAETEYQSFSDGILKVRRETKGRKGKGVTTIAGLAGTEAEIKKVAALLKKKCGTGGAVKDGIIEIQGDKRDVIKLELEKLGHKVKFSGG